MMLEFVHIVNAVFMNSIAWDRMCARQKKDTEFS